MRKTDFIKKKTIPLWNLQILFRIYRSKIHDNFITVLLKFMTSRLERMPTQQINSGTHVKSDNNEDLLLAPQLKKKNNK